MRDTKLSLGKRHIEVIRENNGHPYVDTIPRNITKIKNGNNGFEQYYATIYGKRVEVFQNPNGRTGAAFRLEKSQIDFNDHSEAEKVVKDCQEDHSGIFRNSTCDENGIDRWFDERAQDFVFHSNMNWCSRCNSDNVFYTGISGGGIPFSFCKPCRDELQQLKITRTQSPERFGV